MSAFCGVKALMHYAICQKSWTSVEQQSLGEGVVMSVDLYAQQETLHPLTRTDPDPRVRPAYGLIHDFCATA